MSGHWIVYWPEYEPTGRPGDSLVASPAATWVITRELTQTEIQQYLDAGATLRDVPAPDGYTPTPEKPPDVKVDGESKESTGVEGDGAWPFPFNKDDEGNAIDISVPYEDEEGNAKTVAITYIYQHVISAREIGAAVTPVIFLYNQTQDRSLSVPAAGDIYAIDFYTGGVLSSFYVEGINRFVQGYDGYGYGVFRDSLGAGATHSVYRLSKDSEWQYTGITSEDPLTHGVDEDGHIYMGGWEQSKKYDHTGLLLAAITFPSIASSFFPRIDAQGNFLRAGSTGGPSATRFLQKFTQAGSVLWEKPMPEGPVFSSDFDGKIFVGYGEGDIGILDASGQNFLMEKNIGSVFVDSAIFSGDAFFFIVEPY